MTFLELPREIRNNIYHLLFPQVGVLVYQRGGEVIAHHDRTYQSSILLACRQLHQECMETLATYGVLFLMELDNNPPLALTTCLSPLLLANVQKVSLVGTFSRPPDFRSVVALSELTVLTLDTVVRLSPHQEGLLRGYVDGEEDQTLAKAHDLPPQVTRTEWLSALLHDPTRNYKLIVSFLVTFQFIPKVTRKETVGLSTATASMVMRVKYDLDAEKTADRQFFKAGQSLTKESVMQRCYNHFHPVVEKWSSESESEQQEEEDEASDSDE